MRERFRSWWQQIKQHRVAIEVGAIVFVVVIVLIIVGYLFDWTGFNGFKEVSTAHIISGPSTGTVTITDEYQPGKTLWDWLQLLIIPLVLAITALLFNFASTRTEQKIATQRYEQDQIIALDKQREDLLQIYLDRMSELLLKEKLGSPEAQPEASNVARVRTITILFQLDRRRIGFVFAFLRESGLISTKPNGSIVSLNQADLRKIDFSQADLRKIDFSQADLSGANLSYADLSYADLSGATLYNANLSYATLSGATLNDAYLSHATLHNADLRDAYLTGAILSGATLSFANLSGATLNDAFLEVASLSGTNLSGTDMSGATLHNADMSGANLSGAFLESTNLSGADLSDTNLKDARVTKEHLKDARSLAGATMPDGSIHP